jgi:hypothetical protein
MMLSTQPGQSAYPEELRAAITQLAEQGDTERGAVYTRREVVDAVLDLAGWREDRALHRLRVLEPSFGGGDFLLPIVERLLGAWRRAGGSPGDAVEVLGQAVRGVELHRESAEETRGRVAALLRERGLTGAQAEALTAQWLIGDDFLLTPLEGRFDVVVGNPPYVRQERIPGPLLAEYRRRYRTIYDRADLYVPFFERGLDLLAPGGALGFICADRWMKNRYGGPLRAKIGEGFRLDCVIDLVGADAFHSEVLAYPAITVIRREPPGPTRVARPALAALPGVVTALSGDGEERSIREVPEVARGRDPWLLDSPDELRLLRRLEAALPALEDAGCAVSIGVATGADRAFIGDFDALPVERERKLPLVMAPDLSGGRIQWRGRGVINPFLEDGQLAPLEDFPRFAAWLEAHRAVIAGRHIAKKNPTRWYRTIDRIWPGLVARPKLLIPDIKGGAVVAYDEGRFYPHHNLYYVLSDTWDLRALQAVLRSSLAVMFVAAYCVRMSGGFLRFQAQYLRRIRLPRWDAVPGALRAALTAAAEATDQAAVDRPVFELYGLTPEEREVVTRAAEDAQVRPGKRRSRLPP